jgi:alanyl-tRNA synthetase
MQAREIREEFLSFFEGKGHTRVPSASVVPADDPTLYFTNAGMNQFKDVFLGLGKRSYTRAVDTQKCIRVSGKHNDLEEVGISPWHHTFFEMLGNWSFGDYFKKEAITWAWELVVERYGLDPNRLWATVFEGSPDDGLDPDEDAEKLWVQETPISADRVVRMSAQDNFWEMGESGPCGPCSEMHYYLGDDLQQQSREGLLADSDDFLEIWNLVFIQFNREVTGALQPLPAVHVDTGMGFERMCSLLQGKRTNYDTDLFQPIIERIAELTGVTPEGDRLTAFRVVADHIRALTLAITDGAMPSHDGRGYVLRRILRRASRYGRQLGQHEPFMHELVPTVAQMMSVAFPETLEKCDHVALVVRSEEESFGATLDRGLELFDRISQKGEISGADAFLLHDTYGFPLDLTELMARERGGLPVDTAGFQQELEGQRSRARAANKGHFGATEGVGDALPEGHSRFVGYEQMETASSIVHAEQVESEGEGEEIRLFLEQTPFYAESGGQVGDQGLIEGDGFTIRVGATVKARGGIMHVGRLLTGVASGVRGTVQATVDSSSRLAAARNHTATHLLNEALRRTLGDHVAQTGSHVAPERLRFDFSHFAALDDEQHRTVEAMVNEQIRADLPVETFEEDLERARGMGAQALFGEKYDERVRVVKVGEYSLELCGGTHVASTGEIGLFDFISEAGIAAGTRRAEAVTGEVAATTARQHRDLLTEIGHLLNAKNEQLPGQVRDLLERTRELEKSLSQARQRLASQDVGVLIAAAVDVDGVQVVASRVDVTDVATLRTMADALRNGLKIGVGVLAAALDGKAAFIAVVTDDLISTGKLKAGNIIREVAQIAGGSGGGKSHMAQAGGKDLDKIDSAVAAVPEIVTRQAQG